jgi:hypothetical protein
MSPSPEPVPISTLQCPSTARLLSGSPIYSHVAVKIPRSWVGSVSFLMLAPARPHQLPPRKRLLSQHICVTTHRGAHGQLLDQSLRRPDTLHIALIHFREAARNCHAEPGRLDLADGTFRGRRFHDRQSPSTEVNYQASSVKKVHTR